MNCQYQRIVRRMSIGCLLPIVVISSGASLLAASAAAKLSTWAIPGASGGMIRQPDAFGNRLMDYSGVVYKGRTVPIPDAPVNATVLPVVGDDGAIKAVKPLSNDTNGFRGAILLTAGGSQLSNSITLDASGLVPRGVGDDTNGTLLRATGIQVHVITLDEPIACALEHQYGVTP